MNNIDIKLIITLKKGGVLLPRNEIVRVSLPNVHAHISYQRSQKTYACNAHLHDEIELLRVVSGKLRCVVGDEEYIALPNEVIFVNSRVPHIVTAYEGASEQILVQFRIENFIDSPISKIGTVLARFSEYIDRQCFVIKNCRELCNYIDIINKEFFEKNEGYEKYIKAAIYNIMGYMSRNSLIENHNKILQRPGIERIMPALEYIDENYARDISLEEISGVMNINPYYFCRLFKSATGSSFCEYLNFVRISKSEKMFKDKEKSIMDISLDVGFSSISYFNRVFRKVKGCTPSAYKKAQNAPKD